MTKTDFIKDESPNIEKIKNIDKKIKELTKLMREAAQNLEFEQAMVYRDQLKELEALALKNL